MAVRFSVLDFSTNFREQVWPRGRALNAVWEAESPPACPGRRGPRNPRCPRHGPCTLPAARLGPRIWGVLPRQTVSATGWRVRGPARARRVAAEGVKGQRVRTPPPPTPRPKPCPAAPPASAWLERGMYARLRAVEGVTGSRVGDVGTLRPSASISSRLASGDAPHTRPPSPSFLPPPTKKHHLHRTPAPAARPPGSTTKSTRPL
jgi:hypothetical protein